MIKSSNAIHFGKVWLVHGAGQGIGHFTGENKIDIAAGDPTPGVPRSCSCRSLEWQGVEVSHGGRW